MTFLGRNPQCNTASQARRQSTARRATVRTVRLPYTPFNKILMGIKQIDWNYKYPLFKTLCFVTIIPKMTFLRFIVYKYNLYCCRVKMQAYTVYILYKTV